MRWVIEKSVDVEVGVLERLAEELCRHNQAFDVVQFVPFSHELYPEVSRQKRLFPLGTTSLVRLAQVEKWQPGAFLNDDFDQMVWCCELDEFALNFCAFSRLADAVLTEEKMFIRPTSPINCFGGQVVSKDCFDGWREAAYELPTNGYDTVTPDTMVALARVRKIDAEYRVYVVGGEPITASRYRLNGLVSHCNADDDAALFEFVGKVCARFLPSPHCVVDVADTNRGKQLLEINCLNCSGFYRCDIGKLVAAIVENIA